MAASLTPMISKWQKRKISDWLFALTWAAKTGKTQCAIGHSLLFEQHKLDFHPGFLITQEFQQLLTRLMQYPLSARQFSELYRSAYCYCPCHTAEDWNYLAYLLNTYYATQSSPDTRSSGEHPRLDHPAN